MADSPFRDRRNPQRPTVSRHHSRVPTYPLAHAARRKPRRLPLVLRFAKGAVHGAILAPVVLHSLFAVLVVSLDEYVGNLGLPSTLVPSLSIVVGLMLVFRNQTSYDRFWTGRHCLTTCVTTVRNLSRSFLTGAKHGNGKSPITEAERMDTEKTIRVLLAVLYAIKNNLRNEFQFTFLPSSTRPNSPRHNTNNTNSLSASTSTLLNPSQGNGSTNNYGATPESVTAAQLEYASLLPSGLVGFEDLGLGLPIQLTVMIESYIRRATDRGWFHAPGSSQLTVQLNTLVDAYGKMETIRTTPLPVAHLIHQKQVLALFVGVLPFTTVDEFGWWTVPIVALVAFTLYGIEGIGGQLEDPFGYDRNDIKMDGVIEDARQEVMTLLEEWMSDGKMFE